MTSEVNIVLKKNRKKKSKTPKTISFDEEVVTKDFAQEILSKSEKSESEKTEESLTKKPKKRKKKRAEEADSTEESSEKIEELSLTKKPKKKKKKRSEDCEVTTEKEVSEHEDDLPKKKKRNKLKLDDTTVEDSSGSQDAKKGESIREMKRKKHAKLMEEKKLKTELALQQKSLNYLSKWKHSRDQWKFEKLRQIWLQQNMYDSSKIPEEFWETLVDYFSSSKGKAREVILKDALKAIEKAEEKTETEISLDQDDEESIKLKRARDIIQSLQE